MTQQGRVLPSSLNRAVPRQAVTIMGFRFQKRLRIFKGLTLNLSKSGTSWTLGGRGASVNVRGNKLTGNVGLPGTGLSYRRSVTAPTEPVQRAPLRSALRILSWIAVVVAVVYYLSR